MSEEGKMVAAPIVYALFAVIAAIYRSTEPSPSWRLVYSLLAAYWTITALLALPAWRPWRNRVRAAWRDGRAAYRFHRAERIVARQNRQRVDG
jgi:hypothetical protein